MKDKSLEALIEKEFDKKFLHTGDTIASIDGYQEEIRDFIYQIAQKYAESEFERGRRDVFAAIKVMGREDEGLFILKKRFIDELDRQLKQK